MPFTIGDMVVDPAFGIGRIVDIEDKQFSALQKTRESLYQEWAAGVSTTEATKEIDALLWATRQAAVGLI